MESKMLLIKFHLNDGGCDFILLTSTLEPLNLL